MKCLILSYRTVECSLDLFCPILYLQPVSGVFYEVLCGTRSY